MRTGRPRKERPKLGDPLRPGMSLRDIAKAIGQPRSYVERAIALASLPEDLFEELLQANVSVHQMQLLARYRAGKSIERERRCPACGHLLWTEGRL